MSANIIGIVAVFCVVLVMIGVVITVFVPNLLSPAPAPAPAPGTDADFTSTASASSPAPAPDDDESVDKAEDDTVEDDTVEDDGRCGPNHGDKKCTGKQCCSKSGWCGGEKGTNSNWCININKGWWNGKYDGEEKAPDLVISTPGGYNLHKKKYLPTADGTDVDWSTGEVRPTFGKKVTKVSKCKRRCDDLDACKGFTYKPAIVPNKRKCWLKTDMVQTATLTDSDKYDTYVKE